MSSNTWRNWQPKEETTEQPVKVGGFDGSGGSNTAYMSITPISWGEELHRWMLERCEFRDRCFGAMACLHTDWCEWLIKKYVVVERNNEFFPRAGFHLQILNLGFMAADGLVYGLLLKDRVIDAHAEIEPPKPSKLGLQAKTRTPKTFRPPETYLGGK